jgi:3-deoxy-D-manno-octulosonic-acid transferase
MRIASLWNPKAKKWVQGRAAMTIADMQLQIEKTLPAISKTLWMHCASIGEFEQGRPVVEKVKATNQNIKIVLTFFSASGYEACKDYKGADCIFYLPMDNLFTARKFINAVNPSLVLWVKYDYWFFYLQELKKRGIPVLLISGVFRKSMLFFKSYGKIGRQMLGFFTHFFVQNEASKKLLATLDFTKNVTVSGDTRFDRVIEIANTSLDSPIVKTFCQNKKIIVAGSTWEDDEIILAAYSDETHHAEKLIIAPHELDEKHISTVQKIFKKSICYTEIQNRPALINNLDDYNTLIIDTVGMLSRLYAYGDINYVGGGFTADGVHNVLEAAVWGKPVIFGENYDRHFEATGLIDCLGAESISNTNELKEIVTHLLNNKADYDKSGNAAKEYIYKNGGAADKIVDFIQVNRLFTN